MTQRINHRRGEERHQDNGPTFESPTPNKGANSSAVARARAAWKRIRARAERRTDGTSLGSFWGSKAQTRPSDEAGEP